jgi:hypothetical protein
MDYMASVMWQGKEQCYCLSVVPYSEIAIYHSLQVLMDWPITDKGIGSTRSSYGRVQRKRTSTSKLLGSFRTGRTNLPLLLEE